MSENEAVKRIRAKLDRVPDSDAVTLDKADVRALLAEVSRAAVTEPEWEYRVRTRFAGLDHVNDSEWMDEATARTILGWSAQDHLDRELFKRRKAGPPLPAGGDDE